MYPPYVYPPPPPTPFHMYPPSMFQPAPPPSFYGLEPPRMKNDRRHRGESRSSPPRSSPPPAEGSVDSFCQQYELKDSVCSGLKELGFEIGDDLSSVKESQWERVGIPLLAVVFHDIPPSIVITSDTHLLDPFT
jgi:hypothetical protein